MFYCEWNSARLTGWGVSVATRGTGLGGAQVLPADLSPGHPRPETKCVQELRGGQNPATRWRHQPGGADGCNGLSPAADSSSSDSGDEGDNVARFEFPELNCPLTNGKLWALGIDPEPWISDSPRHRQRSSAAAWTPPCLPPRRAQPPRRAVHARHATRKTKLLTS